MSVKACCTTSPARASTQCVAVGYREGTGGIPRSLALHRTGSHVVRRSRVPNRTNNDNRLYDVACPTSTKCYRRPASLHHDGRTTAATCEATWTRRRLELPHRATSGRHHLRRSTAPRPSDLRIGRRQTTDTWCIELSRWSGGGRDGLDLEHSEHAPRPSTASPAASASRSGKPPEHRSRRERSSCEARVTRESRTPRPVRTGGRFGRLAIIVALACGLLGLTPLPASAASDRRAEARHADVRRPRAGRPRTRTAPAAPAPHPRHRALPPARQGPVPAGGVRPRQRRPPGEAVAAPRGVGPGRICGRRARLPPDQRRQRPAVDPRRLRQPARRRQLRDRRGPPPLPATGVPPLYRRVDPHHIGLAGHSLGGATAYGVAFNTCCRRPPDRRGRRDGRPSSPLPRRSGRLPATPLLLIHLLGDPVVPFTYAEDVFAAAKPPKYLMALQRGRPLRAVRGRAEPARRAVVAATTAFWDAYLRGERAARREVVRAGTEPGRQHRHCPSALRRRCRRARWSRRSKVVPARAEYADHSRGPEWVASSVEARERTRKGGTSWIYRRRSSSSSGSPS